MAVPQRPGAPLSDLAFRQIVENSHEGVWVLDSGGITTYVNARMADLLGYSPAEMIGRTAFDFVWPQDVERGLRDWQERRSAAGGRQAEFRYRHKDGHPVWCLATTTLLTGGDGRAAGVLGMFADITERKRVEEALRASEERYRSLFESMSEGFVVGQMIYDEAGRAVDYQLVEANPAYERLTGLSREASLRQTMKQLVPTLEQTWIDRHARVAATGETERWSAYNAHVDQYYEMYTFRPAPGMFASIFMNVSDRKRAEEELEQSRRRLTAQADLLTAIIDNIPVLLAIWDPEMRSFRFNRHFRAILGWTEADAAGGDFMSLAYPDPDYRRQVTDYMLSHRSGWRDLITTAKNGSRLDISWANVALPEGWSKASRSRMWTATSSGRAARDSN